MKNKIYVFQTFSKNGMDMWASCGALKKRKMSIIIL